MKKRIKKILKREYLCFGVVGGAGFLIDTGVFSVLHTMFGYTFARFASISIALTCCWLANRMLTFRLDSKISFKEWLKYVTTNGMGATINFFLFLALCQSSFFLKEYYLLPLMIATSVSMVWNFLMMKHVVFR